jgi:seryl-tRNA synthetase
MLQVAVIREDTERIIAGLAKRNFKDAERVIRQVLDSDLHRRDTQKKLDELKSKLNTSSKQIGVLMQAGQKEEAGELRARVGQDKDSIKHLESKLDQFEKDLVTLLYTIPNIPAEIVPSGSRPEDNQVVHEHGTIPNLHADALPHWELIRQYDIIDFELGNKIAGAGFPVYKGKGARLQRALINFFLDEAVRQGYTEVQPPIVVNEASGYGTGQLPDKEGQMYFVGDDGLYLIPTAEVPITNLYRDVIVADENLPVKHVGYTPCFRREAGSWGAHVRGLNRLHQFDKVEIVQITRPESSYQALDEMCTYVQSLLEKLELTYRKLLLCGGDMGFNAAITYDMEVFSGGQQRWLEVSSVSNFETYQANRLKLRHRVADGKIQLLHTLNGSALALPRIVAAILENNQTKDGIRLPEILVPYAGFDRID